MAIAAILGYGLLCRWENARRDRVAESDGTLEPEMEAFSDLTDKEKPAFRSIY